jgi:hypothetical protein
MNRIKLVLGLLAAGAVSSASAQSLQFTNLTLSTSPNLFHGLTNQLNSVVYDGSSNFLAVGANQIYVYGNFQPGQTLIASSSWVTNQILPANGLDLDSVTIGNNTFVTTGTSNAVFSAANVFSPAGLSWSHKHNIFSSTGPAPGIAYNNGGFSAVTEAPQISWSGSTLPTTTTWAVGTLANADFLESFRGVTPYGANGFAACGLYADVRLSANGTNWPAAVSGHIGLPDFYAIAYDGVQTLVAVGATNSSSSDNGIIMASTNSGFTTWKTVYVNSTANTPLNAVTYTGSGFIAVGSKGQVLTSPNGVSWTPVINSLVNVDLDGVAYANNGPLNGVAELVGDSGAVILAATPPPSPINPVGETNCSTYPNPPAYSALSVTPVANASHPAGTITVEWFDAQGNVVASGTTNLFPTVNPNLVGTNAVTNIVYYAAEQDLRTGFISTNKVAVTLQIIPRPTATLINPSTTVCNEGASFTLTNILTGIGPWTIDWNDGTVQTIAQAVPGPVVLTRTVTPTNTFANVASNNVYFVTILTNADMCQGNVAGDITGTTTITVDPRPTASLMSLDATNCNDGSSFTLTNTLTGIGPWTIFWNDGTTQTANGSGPLTLTRTVFPTNSVGANTVNDNIYYVTMVTNNDNCIGNQPGDVTGTNHIFINPRPTAKLLSVTVTNCNVGTLYTLTNTLTGIGPWTVVWNDGLIETTNGTAPLILTRNVTPTTGSANAASNNVYFVTMVTNNTDTCIGNQPGDITGSAQFIINPLPTVTLTITTNDFALSTNDVATGLLESVSQPSGTSYSLVVGFQTLQNGNPTTINNQTLSVTNHLAFTGIGPWAVMLSDGNTSFATNFAANGTYVWNEVVSTNVNTNFTFSVTSLTDTNTGCSGSETNVYSVGVFDAPTALVLATTNTACGSGVGSVTISAALGGFGPWTNIVWSDGFVSGLVSNSPVSRDVAAPTNNSFAQIETNYSIVSLTDGYGITTTSSNDLAGAAIIIVDPFPTNPPTVVVATNYTCPSTPVILSVSVPPNFTADWFADSGLTTNLAVGTTNYLASITDDPATNVYYVTMRYNDAFSLANCSPDVAASVYLISAPCTNAVISSITATNGSVIISWSGNYVLQGTTNLTPPAIWFNLSTGQLGPNFLTNSILNGSPYEFFRLYAPTN